MLPEVRDDVYAALAWCTSPRFRLYEVSTSESLYWMVFKMLLHSRGPDSSHILRRHVLFYVTPSVPSNVSNSHGGKIQQ